MCADRLAFFRGRDKEGIEGIVAGIEPWWRGGGGSFPLLVAVERAFEAPLDKSTLVGETPFSAGPEHARLFDLSRPVLSARISPIIPIYAPRAQEARANTGKLDGFRVRFIICFSLSFEILLFNLTFLVDETSRNKRNIRKIENVTKHLLSSEAMKGENLERISEIKGERIAVLEKRMIFSEREGGEAKFRREEKRERETTTRRRWIIGEKTRGGKRNGKPFPSSPYLEEGHVRGRGNAKEEAVFRAVSYCLGTRCI